MKIEIKSCSISLAPAFLILFLILTSSTASASTATSSLPVDPYAYITNSGSNTVSVIDTVTNTVTTTVNVGDWPFGIAVFRVLADRRFKNRHLNELYLSSTLVGNNEEFALCLGNSGVLRLMPLFKKGV